MRWLRRTALFLMSGVFLTGVPRALYAQTLLTNALSWFPQQTVALEYSDASTLRSLPDYASLRSHYLGKNLRTLESSLAQIGIREGDVDQMVLGWQTGVGKGMRYEGIATGEFSADSVARQAAIAKIAPRAVGGFQAYCFPQDPNQTCVAVVDGSLGLFGPLPYLEGMLKARAGDGPSIASNVQFTQYVRNAQSDAPIWGVALGPAVAKWFKAWMPGEKNLQMDWAAAFKDVRAISYEIETGDNLNLNVKLDCASQQAASSVRQLLEGMKLVQQMAWQTSNPGQPNPFKNVTVEADSRQVSFKLTAAYAALERAGPLGHL